MALVRALENRRKMEEKEKKRLEARAERIATKEKRAEQRRVEMELIEQIRKPVEDMELTGTRTKGDGDRYRLLAHEIREREREGEYISHYRVALIVNRAAAEAVSLVCASNECVRFFRSPTTARSQKNTWS